MAYATPQHEESRQRELESFQVLDTPAESTFDSLVALAAEICEVPIALVTLVDKDRQWFKSAYGLETQETPREHAFCAHAIQNPYEMMVVPDAAKDQRFATNPLVTGETHIRI